MAGPYPRMIVAAADGRSFDSSRRPISASTSTKPPYHVTLGAGGRRFHRWIVPSGALEVRRAPMSKVGSDDQVDLMGETALRDQPQASAFESLLRQVARAPVEDLSPTEELGSGAIVADRFEVVREIGRGGFARVFEAYDRVLSRSVAIKLLKRRRRLNDSELELFYREARATARLNHPHIVTAYDWGAWNDTPFLVLELLDGESLDKQLEHGPMAEKRAWEIVT